MKTNYLKMKIVHHSIFCLGMALLYPTTSVIAQEMSKKENNPKMWTKGGLLEGFEPHQEILSKRTSIAKHFLNSDGSMTAQLGLNHYKDAQGQWQDVDLKIQPTTLGFANTSNFIKTSFPKTSGTHGVYMQFDETNAVNIWNANSLALKTKNGIISQWKPQQKTGSISENQITYTGIYPNIAEQFEILPSGIEHNIIMSSLGSDLRNVEAGAHLEFSQTIPLQRGWQVYSNGKVQTSNFVGTAFEIRIPGLKEGVHISPIVVFDNELTKDRAFLLLQTPAQKLSAKDKNDLKNHLTQIKHEVVFNGDQLVVTTKMPVDWLKKADRKFPVTIDPTITYGEITYGSYSAPLTNWFGYQKTANLYLETELNAFGKISSIEYYKTNTAAARTKPVKVYSKFTRMTTLTTAAWNSATYTKDLTANYDNNLAVDNTIGWKNIPLATSVTYSRNNLMFMVIDNYGGSGQSQYMAYKTSGVTGRQAKKRSDTTDSALNSAMDVENYLASMRINYTDLEPAVYDSISKRTMCLADSLTIYGNKLNNFNKLKFNGAFISDDQIRVISDNVLRIKFNSTGTDRIEILVHNLPSVFTDTLSVNSPVNLDQIVGNESICINTTPTFTNTTNNGFWSVTNLTGSATISDSGELQPTQTGTVKLRYLVTQPCDVFVEKTITIKTAPEAPEIFVTNNAFCPGETIQVVGSLSGTWNSNDILYTDQAATIPYVDGVERTYVFVKPTANTAVTLTKTNNVGCSESLTTQLVGNAISDLPIGDQNQTFNIGQTISVLQVTGQNLVWYADAEGTQVIPYNTPLVDGNTYYVSQRETGKCISELLPITVEEVLSNSNFDENKITAYPNPVSDVLNLSHTNGIKEVSLYNMLGQLIFKTKLNEDQAKINVSNLSSGNYILKMTNDHQVKSIKITKI